jgi:multidrug resistance efflux pump
VGDALASSKRSGKSTRFLLSAYTAAEVLSAESKAQLAGERDVIGREEAADVRVAIEASQNANLRLTELYGDGVINSPVTGIVGSLDLSEGSVVREAEPLMEIFTGPPFVLAYVPHYNVQKG